MPKLPTHPRTPQGLPASPPGGPQDTHKHHKHLRGSIQELPGTARNSRFQPLGPSAPQGGPQSAPSGARERLGGLQGPLVSAQKMADPPLGAIRGSPWGAEVTQRSHLMFLKNFMFSTVLSTQMTQGRCADIIK